MPARPVPAARRESRRLLLFVLRALLVWVPLQFLIWPAAQPLYSAAVAGTANSVLAALEAGERVTRLRLDGAELMVFSDLREDGRPADTYNADLLHFYAVLLISLLLAYPGLSARRRLGWIGAGLAAVFAFHVVAILIKVEHMYAVTLVEISARNYTDLERWLYGWLHDTVIYFAVQLVPAFALLLLFVTHGLGPSQSTPSPRPRGPVTPTARRSRRRRLLMAAASLAMAAAITPVVLLLPKIRARQAEKECMLAYHALVAGDTERAFSLFTLSMARNPSFQEARVGMGETLARQKKLPEAIELFRSVLRDDPDRGTAHLGLANALFAIADYPGALPEFRAAVQRDPDLPMARINLAITLSRLGRIEEAERDLREILADHPADAEALFQLSALLIAQRRACEALPFLRRSRATRLGGRRAELVEATIADLRGRCGKATP